MGKGISIPVLSDTKQFATGVQSGVVKPLEDAVDSIKDLGKAGDKTGDQLESGMKDAQQATSKYEKALKDAVEQQQKVAKSAKTSTREVSDDFEISAREQTHLRKESIKEIGNEAKANAAETFSSFNGSASSFVDGIQGTLGGLVSSLGPTGLALGAAGALAIGLINGALQNADTQSQEFKQSVSDLTGELIATGRVGTIGIDQILEELKKLATEADSGKESLSKIKVQAHDTDQGFKSLAQAFAGNEAALHKAIDATKEKIAAESAHQESIRDTNRAEAIASSQRMGENQTLLSGLEAVETKQKTAAANAKLYAEAGGPELQARVDLLAQVNTAYDDAAGSVDDYVDSESGIFNVDKYIAAMQAKQKALEDYQTTLNSSGLTDSAKAFLESQGADAAATLLAGYKSGSDAQKAALAAIWNEAGKTSSGAYTKSTQDGINAWKPSVPDIQAKVTLDDIAANAKLRALGSGVNIKVDSIVTRSGVRVL